MHTSSQIPSVSSYLQYDFNSNLLPLSSSSHSTLKHFTNHPSFNNVDVGLDSEDTVTPNTNNDQHVPCIISPTLIT